MLQNLYYALAGICATLAAIIPSTGNAYDSQRMGSIFRKLTFRGYLTIVFLLSALFFSFLKDRLSSNEQDDKLTQRDSTIKSLIKENEEKRAQDSRLSLATYTEALAKYNLQYIEGQDKVVKMIRDSSNRPLNIPAFDLCKYPNCTDPVVFEPGDDTKLAIKFDNTGASAFNIDLKINFCIKKNNRIYADTILQRFFKKTLLNTDQTTTIHFSIGQPYEEIDTIYLCFSGIYFNSDDKKFPVYSIHACSIKKREYIGPIGGPVYEDITQSLKLLKIIK